MLSALRTRRWQGFTALVVVAIIAFGLLSRWQWSRADEKRVAQLAQRLADQEAVVPAVGERLPEFTAVQIEGTYLPGATRLVRQRPLEGRNGYWVLDLLRGVSGDIWVLRGWLPAGPRTDISPDVPAIDGLVRIDGVVRPLVPGQGLLDRGGLPADQVTDIHTAQLPEAGTSEWFAAFRLPH